MGRDLPSVAALNDLIVVGPGSSAASTMVDIYDTKTQAWRPWASVKKLTYSRMGASAVAAGNRYYFICGGSGTNDLGFQEVRAEWAHAATSVVYRLSVFCISHLVLLIAFGV